MRHSEILARPLHLFLNHAPPLLFRVGADRRVTFEAPCSRQHQPMPRLPSHAFCLSAHVHSHFQLNLINVVLMLTVHFSPCLSPCRALQVPRGLSTAPG